MEQSIRSDLESLQQAVDSFHMLADGHQRINRISKAAKEALKSNYRTPQEMHAFIENHGTPVYLLKQGWLKNLDNRLMLHWLGFDFGFIPMPSSLEGQKRYQKLVQWLTRAEEHSPIYFDERRFEQGVFVLVPPVYNVPFLTHQLHHWMSCRAGLEGYSDASRQLYQSFWNDHQGQLNQKTLDKMSTDQVIALKQAINRDLEALCFLRQVVDEIFVPANQGKHLKSTL